MSTLTAPGVRLDITGPRPVAPPHSLLNTEGVVVETDEGRWLNGVVLDDYPADLPHTWDPCSDGTVRVKVSGAGKDQSTFDPFVIYVPVICSYFSSNGLREMAQIALDARQSFAVEFGLAHGVAGMVNPFLGDGNLSQLGGNGISVIEGLARLENAIGLTGQQGLIHATPATITRMNTDTFIDPDNLVTTNGNRVVSGGGYIGIHPLGKTASSDGQDWMFATGPVEVRLSPPAIQDVRTSLDRSDNTIEFRAERAALPVWDQSLQVGVLVDWAP